MADVIIIGNDVRFFQPNLVHQVIETFRVECVVNGYPSLPRIRWYKDDVEITSSSPIYDLQKRNYLQITSQ